MGTKELRGRDNWQDVGGQKAGATEKLFYQTMQREFADTDFRIRSKPQDFIDIYSQTVLSKDVLSAIYNPAGETWTHGIVPDYAIDNALTKKTLYVEVKRQDGWVENKPRSAGRGNAHERSCKLFTPGLLKTLKERGGLGAAVLPFWVVFEGDIARDPKRVREIHHWFEGYSNHFFLWSNSADTASLTRHFNTRLKALLL